MYCGDNDEQKALKNIILEKKIIEEQKQLFENCIQKNSPIYGYAVF